MRITANEHLEIFYDIESGNPTQNRTSRVIDHWPNNATVITAKNNRIALQTHPF